MPACATLGEPHADPPHTSYLSPLGPTPSNLVRLQQLLLQVPVRPHQCLLYIPIHKTSTQSPMWRDDDDDFDGGLPELLLRVLSVLRRTDERTDWPAHTSTTKKSRQVGLLGSTQRTEFRRRELGRLLGSLVAWFATIIESHDTGWLVGWLVRAHRSSRRRVILDFFIGADYEILARLVSTGWLVVVLVRGWSASRRWRLLPKVELEIPRP